MTTKTRAKATPTKAKQVPKQNASQLALFARTTELTKAVEELKNKTTHALESAVVALRENIRVEEKIDNVATSVKELKEEIGKIKSTVLLNGMGLLTQEQQRQQAKKKENPFVAMLEEFMDVSPEHKQALEDLTQSMQRKLDKYEAKKEYVLTDADWQRVIDEEWLCEFDSGQVGYLRRLLPERPGAYRFKMDLGLCKCCRPLNKPGVMQPYFGQGMPVPPETRVSLKFNNGQWDGGCLAKDYTWSWRDSKDQIIAFIILT